LAQRFEWDEAKSDGTLQLRGFDFAYASLIFDGPVLEADDPRRAYGERRIAAIGRVGPDVLFIIYTWRGDARRILSARLASRKERDAYRETFG
jgi:uncharacterized DUF497 family protein